MKKILGSPHKRIRMILALSLLLAAVCLVQMARPNRQYVYEGSANFAKGYIFGEEVVYEQIALPPGIYEVALEYQAEKNLEGVCTVRDNTVFTGGLLTNGEHLYSGLTHTSFRFWLFESTEALEVVLTGSGEQNLQVGNLTIYETNQLWSMLLTVIIVAAGILLGAEGLGTYEKKHPIDREKKNVAFGLGVIVLIASLPYLLGVSISGADLSYHLQRIEGVKDGILSGQFPVRLEPEWVHGHGYANGIFYCNALLLFPALLRLLGFTITTSYNCYAVGLNIATAGISYYCFSRIFKNRYIGLICSGLYTLSVFRIYRLVIVSTVGEGSAITFMPLILYGFYRVLTENPKEKAYKTAWICLALGYAGVIQTHVLSCEITAVLTVIACLIFVRKILRRETFLELVKGALGAVALSLWYLIPFLDYYINEDVHIKHVSRRTIQDRGVYLRQLIFPIERIGSNAAPDNGGIFSPGVGLVFVLGFIMFLVLWLCGRWKKENGPVTVLGKASVIFSGCLMAASLRIFPWDWIQSLNGLTASLVSSLQFPYRFLGWGTVFLTTVFGCCLWYFAAYKKQYCFYAGITLALISIMTSSMLMVDYLNRDHGRYRLYNEEGMGFGYISGAEYLIEGTKEELLYYKEPIAGEGVEILSYRKDYLNVEMKCVNRTEQESYVELPILHYKGYRAQAEGMGEPLAVEKGENNVVRVCIPPSFEGRILVGFVSPLAWRLGEAVTYAAWIGLLLFRARYWRRGRKSRQEEAECTV